MASEINITFAAIKAKKRMLQVTHTGRKLATAALAVAACTLSAWADATPNAAASQAWVSNYVEIAIAGINTRVAASNNVAVVTAGDIVMTMEPSSDAALVAQDSLVPAITNGTVFVWNGAGAYINPLGTITSTRTNMVYNGVGSVYTNDILRFAGRFDARAVRIQPSTSYAITNGMQEVTE